MPDAQKPTLDERVEEIAKEYWRTREHLAEREAVSHLFLALARAERDVSRRWASAQ